MKTKIKLKIDYDYDFFLFGITCGERPYRVCWALNQQLNASFSKEPDKDVKTKNSKEPVYHEVFFSRNENRCADYRVIVNKSGSHFFASEYKYADYLLMMQGEISWEEKEVLLKKIKSIPFVQTAFEISPQRLKEKENFLF